MLSPGHSWPVRELTETISYELALQGVPSTLTTDGFPEPRPGLLYVLMAPREFLRLEGSEALPDEALLRRTVMIGVDSPAGSPSERLCALARAAGAVFEIDLRTVRALRRLGIPARHLRPGYSALRDRFAAASSRPIDVLFLGTWSKRRARLLSAAAPTLARYNCLINLSEPGARNATGSSSFIAESKYDLLAQSKVVLNLHRGERRQLEWLRVLEAIHCGAVVVSEHSFGLDPFEPGEHLLVASGEALPFAIECVVGDEALAQRLREQAYERLRSWLPFALSIGVLRAALVELVGNPVPPGAGRGRRPQARPERPDRWQPALGRRAARYRAPAIGLELERARQELARLRQQLAELRGELDHGQRPGFALRAQTPAWRARRGVAVSALVAIEEHPAEAVIATLGSLAASRTCDVELVAVCPVEAAGALRAVQAWLTCHPRVPALLLCQLDARGRGSALNAALEHARGAASLITAPGEVLYPRCLEVLAALLAATAQAAVVYPICELPGAEGPFGCTPARLCNQFGWEPGRLRLGQTVASPYLVRTSVLRKLGGFATDPRLYGHEDYDLLCRLAEGSMQGLRVPQILARRARAPAVVVEDGAWRALSERAPRLHAGSPLSFAA